jgi:tRNA nucleotidyltransferase (CCA-adding enzyme)
VEGREDIRKIVSRKTNSADSRLLGIVRRRVARLGAEADLADLSRVARRYGARVWIVGGALRDLALGRRVAEVDVAVDGDARSIAAAMEALGRGRAVLLSGDRSPRVYRVAGRRRIVDVAEIEGGSIEADLARRDFTVNAVAAELPKGDILDPFAGLKDLATGRLRMVSEKNLRDDPLRPLRAARLLATHGLVPDRNTSRASRAAAADLPDAARERVQAELARMLEAPRAAPALSWMSANDLAAPAFRIGIPHEEWIGIARGAAVLDSTADRRRGRVRVRRLRLAFVASRFGLSPREAASWLREGRWGRDEAEEVSRLVELAAAASKSDGAEGDWRWLLKAGDAALDALRLLAIVEPASSRSVRRLRARAVRRRRVPSVRGADVLAWMRIAPGPDVGRWLDAVRIEALAGRIRTRTDARRWLSSLRNS